MTAKELQTKLDGYLMIGDEKSARKFINDHYLDLPNEWQEKLAWAFVDEAAAYAEREAASLSYAGEAESGE